MTAVALPLTISEADFQRTVIDTALLYQWRVSGSAFVGERCDNDGEAGRRANVTRPLTHSLDLGEEGLAMQATRRPCACGCGRLAKAGRNYVLGHKPATLEGRMMAKVSIDPETGCWIWSGARHPLGYGNVNIGGGQYTSTHRAMYEIHRGPIPTGLDLDHLCRNPPCCNPEHLEPVTHGENVRRGEAPNIVASRAGTCTQGHPLAEHASRRKGSGTVIYCRACRRERRAAS